jgi:hypothetical protein
MSVADVATKQTVSPNLIRPNLIWSALMSGG